MSKNRVQKRKTNDRATHGGTMKTQKITTSDIILSLLNKAAFGIGIGVGIIVAAGYTVTPDHSIAPLRSTAQEPPAVTSGSTKTNEQQAPGAAGYKINIDKGNVTVEAPSDAGEEVIDNLVKACQDPQPQAPQQTPRPNNRDSKHLDRAFDTIDKFADNVTSATSKAPEPKPDPYENNIQVYGRKGKIIGGIKSNGTK